MKDGRGRSTEVETPEEEVLLLERWTMPSAGHRRDCNSYRRAEKDANKGIKIKFQLLILGHNALFRKIQFIGRIIHHKTTAFVMISQRNPQ